MHFTKLLSMSHLGRQFRISSRVRKQQCCGLFVPIGFLQIPLTPVRSAYYSSSMMRMIDKAKFNRIMVTKTALKHAQHESKALVAPWIAQHTSPYCEDSSNKHGIHTGLKQDHPFKDAIKKKREQLIESEQKLRKTSQTILKDIRETKDKMRERMEDVIEVINNGALLLIYSTPYQYNYSIL
jgi:hypothetical protein